LLKQKPFDNIRKFKWLEDIAAGINHLHAKGIVHRDLAARNVLVSFFSLKNILN
jgi:serine/threonine protein kinase